MCKYLTPLNKMCILCADVSDVWLVFLACITKHALYSHSRPNHYAISVWMDILQQNMYASMHLMAVHQLVFHDVHLRMTDK